MRRLYFSLIIGVLLSVFPHVVSASPVPRIQDQSLRPQQLANLIGNRQLMILHREKPIQVNGSTETVRFVTSMTVMDTSVERVREKALDIDSYDQFVPQTEIAKVVSRDTNNFKAKFHLSLKMPIMNTDLYYTNKYTRQSSGDVTFELVSGDLSAVYGRYEFIRLNDHQTLVAYTLWTDFRSGFGYFSPAAAMYSAQPDLEIAVPVSQNAVFMRALRKRVETVSPEKKSGGETLASAPNIPTFADRKLPLSSLRSLYDLGTLLFVHQPQRIRTDGDSLSIQFVSAMGVADTALKQSRRLLTQFENFPRFVEQVSSVESQTTEYGYKAKWHLDIGLSILSAGIDYQLEYRWRNKDKRTLEYRIQPGGDLDHVYGALEWIPVNPSKTIFFYTVASQIGENASYLVKLGNFIPNRQLVVGVSSGALAVEKQMKWIRELNTGQQALDSRDG
ncbi:MAG: hypothetical protein ABEK50_15725 [bacterium]